VEVDIGGTAGPTPSLDTQVCPIIGPEGLLWFEYDSNWNFGFKHQSFKLKVLRVEI
jgi:hypothetical protein